MKRIVFALALLITSWSSASLTDGLVGYWPFDGDAKDYSGNGNHGVKHGVSLKADRDGHSDCAYSFGESDYITVPANSQLNAISDFTMCVWIKPTSWDNGYWLPIMCKGETRQYGLEITDEGCQDLIYHAEEEVHVSIDHNYKSCFEFYYERNSFLCTSHKLRIGEWMHIAATRSNGHLSVYINGTKIGSDTGANPPASNAGSLNIGRDPPGGMEYFHGLMDDVCLYNRALSAAEVSAIYNGGLKLGKVVFNANAVEVEGTMPSLSVLSGTQEKLPENAFRRHDGYVFQGWAKSKSDADNGIVKYQDEEEITIESDMTLYAVWQASLPDVVVHFNANGGVFKNRKTGEKVNEFDQCFVYGETQRLFTDELTPLKPDGNGNQFLGWVRGTPNVYSDSDIIDGRKEETFYTYDGTETTYYAVWTTTVTVSFYNDTDVDSGRRILSPNSLGNHLSWSVDAGAKRYKNGESVQVFPGQRIIHLYVDDDYHWIAGRFDLGADNPYFHRAYDYLELNIENDFRDGSTPREYEHDIYVKVDPDISQPETHGRVVFFYSAAVREELRGLINAQRGNVPVFDISKVRISIGKTAVNQSGNVVEDSAHGLTGLELHKYYCLPTGLYYLKDVVYDADASSGDPYWGAVLDSTLKNQLIEVKDGRFTERTIDFDVFGGKPVVRVVFDPQGGECARPDMWFLYHSAPYSKSGWISIDKKTADSLPTPERGEDFIFLAWFTERSGGLEFKSGATIYCDKVHWSLPFERTFTFYAYARWTNMADYWMYLFPNLVTASGGDIVTAAKMTAANGCRTVGECYALGINPADPNDDLKITDFKMEGGKPVITLNHTEDGSGNSFLPRVKTLGKADLSDATEEWRVVPEGGDQTMRFFKIDVEMP